ncbi:nitroreductase family protein [Paenibacillus frigoriresistens]|uniref:nitroreductase family protein n=1 Tax=Paenibacillus alginolyticus TaxID=59839 RepID=UPI0015650FBC|nr:nitroreductase family protein [Paenibacillus frigoriresistens]NRF91929.1 nitroreductase family protein [Paenibacillus frigoriresistens]
MSNRLIGSRLELEGIELPEEMMNQTLEVLTTHESVRGFQKKPLPEGALKAILTAARSAPTSSNLQAYSIIVVTNEERKNRLAVLSGNQGFIKEAPVFLVFCADIYRLKYVTMRQGYQFAADTLEMFLLAAVDAALALQNALVAADSLGLVTVPVGSVRNDPNGMAEELGLPDGVFAIAGLSIGFEREGVRRGVKPRLPEQITVSHEQYSTTFLEEGLAEYDRVMIERRTYDGRRVSIAGEPEREGMEYGWCEHSARRCTRPEAIAASASLRENLRQILEQRGFSFQ